MICEVMRTIEEERLLDGVSGICVGVSGGADSVCLLDVLCTLQPQFGYRLQAVHVHHGLRGAEADRDAAFTEDLCRRFGVPCKVVHADAAAEAKRLGISVEEAGRRIRYEAFFATNCDAVAVAHTRDDRMETALFHLARGTALRGAAGIPAKRGNVIRPLLRVSRKDIEAHLASRGLPFVTDSTNCSDDYTRNFIRHNIIPAFRTVNPSFDETFTRFLDTARQQSDCIRAMAQDALKAAALPNGYAAPALQSLHPAVRREALLMLLTVAMEKQPEARHIALCEQALLTGGKVQLSADCSFSADADTVRLCKKAKPLSPWALPFDATGTATPAGFIRLVPASGQSVLAKEKLQGELLLRSRRAGDVFCDAKRGCSKTLKKLFNEAKIPPEDRNRIAVLTVNGRIAWVQGFGADKAFLAADGEGLLPDIQPRKQN